MSDNNTATTDRFLTVAEVSSLSGLTEKTVRDHISAGRLKAHQIGGRRGRIRISQADVYEWLSRSPVRSTEKLEEIDWSVPRDPSAPDDLTVCDEYTLFILVAQSRLGEFFAKKQELGR